MAAKKTAAKKATSPDVVSTVTEDTTGGVPYLDPELERIRDEARKAEPEVKVAEAEEPTIDPALVEAREKALKAEQSRKKL